jgi:hypothetical protein
MDACGAVAPVSCSWPALTRVSLKGGLMQSLANAQVIGGVAVEIGARLDGVRAGVAETKQMVGAVDKLVGTVKLVADTTQLKATMARLALPPIVVPLILDMRPAVAQLAMLRSSTQLALPGGTGGGRGGGGAPFDFEGEVVSSRMTPSGAAAGAPTQAGPAWWNRPLPGSQFLAGKMHGLRGLKHLKTFFYTETALAAADVVGQGVNMLTAKTKDERAAASEAAGESISSVPILGPMIKEGLEKIIDVGSGFGNLFTGHGYRTLRGGTKQVLEDAKKIGEKTEQMATRAELGKKRREAVENQAYQDRIEYARNPAEAELIAAQIEREKFVDVGGAGIDYKGGLSRIDRKIARAGEAVTAERFGRDAEVAGAQRVEGEGRLDKFQDVQRRKLTIGLETNRVLASAQVAGIKLAGESYGADLKAFDEAAKEKKLVAGREAYEFTREQWKGHKEAERETAAERARQDRENDVEAENRIARRVLVAQQSKSVALTSGKLQSIGAVAGMRAGHQDRAADLKEFDDETKRMLDSGEVDAKLRGDFINSRAQQRAAIVSSQQESRQVMGIGLEGRVGSAQAASRNQPMLAGTLEMIAGMKTELALAKADDRPQIATAQGQIVQALIAGMNRPTGYATSSEIYGEAPGGPTGDAGADIAETLKALFEFLKSVIPQGRA